MRRVVAVLLPALVACTAADVDETPATAAPTAETTTTSARAAAGWVEVAPMIVARSEHPAVVLNGEIVVAGGLVEVGIGRTGVTGSVEAYSVEGDGWRALPDLPEARHHLMAAAIGGRFFVIGGYSPTGEPTTTVWELVGEEWAARAPLSAPVAAGSAVTLGESLHVIGGVPDGGHYVYEVETDQWSELPPPGEQREHVAAAVLDGMVWAIAGRWAGEFFDTTEMYDAGSGAWTSGPALGEARSGFGATPIGDSIIVAGGEVFSPDTALTSVERFDQASDSWSMIEALPRGLHGNPLVTVGGDIFLPGGSTRAADVVNDGRTYRFTPGDTGTGGG